MKLGWKKWITLFVSCAFALSSFNAKSATCPDLFRDAKANKLNIGENWEELSFHWKKVRSQKDPSLPISVVQYELETMRSFLVRNQSVKNQKQKRDIFDVIKIINVKLKEKEVRAVEFNEIGSFVKELMVKGQGGYEKKIKELYENAVAKKYPELVENAVQEKIPILLFPTTRKLNQIELSDLMSQGIFSLMVSKGNTTFDGARYDSIIAFNHDEAHARRMIYRIRESEEVEKYFQGNWIKYWDFREELRAQFKSFISAKTEQEQEAAEVVWFYNEHEVFSPISESVSKFPKSILTEKYVIYSKVIIRNIFTRSKDPKDIGGLFKNKSATRKQIMNGIEIVRDFFKDVEINSD